jgi:hypothetical protein
MKGHLFVGDGIVRQRLSVHDCKNSNIKQAHGMTLGGCGHQQTLRRCFEKLNKMK